jgi:hypothetical protein
MEVNMELKPDIIFILIGGALFVHGVGHSLGYFRPGRSWLMPRAKEGTIKLIAGIFWALAIVGFVAASFSFLGFLLPTTLWRQLACIFAVESIIGLILFGGVWPKFNLVAAFVFNLVVLLALLWYHWPPYSMYNR